MVFALALIALSKAPARACPNPWTHWRPYPLAGALPPSWGPYPLAGGLTL